MGKIEKIVKELDTKNALKDIEISYIRRDDSKIKISKIGKKAVIEGNEISLRRAVNILIARTKENSDDLYVEEERLFDDIGVMLDCSRNGVLNINYLKKELIKFSGLGINKLYLYIEDIYEIEEEPYFGAYRGRYKQVEIKELCEFASNLGIEIVPCIQTLAHLRAFLRWPVAKKYRDTEDILLVEDEEVRILIKNMLKSIASCFKSKEIHIGMDEAHSIGLGEYLKKNGYKDRNKLIHEHLEYVMSCIKELGKEGIIWSDMYFRLKSKTGDYYDVEEDTEFEEILDDKLSLVYWDYYHHDEEIYEKNFRLHRKLTKKIIFAGGGWSFNGISPNYSKAFDTLKKGLTVAKREGIDRVICTFWFDNGMETPADTCILPSIFFSDFCYGSEETSLYKHYTGYSKEEWLLLDRLDNIKSSYNEKMYNPSKWAFYQDPMLGIFDFQIEKSNLEAHYKKLEEEFESILPNRGEYDSIFRYYRLLTEILAEKTGLVKKIREAYKAEKELSPYIDILMRCAEKVDMLKDLREEIWYTECKSFGFEVVDIRFAGLSSRLRSAAKRLIGYQNKLYDRLEELEEERLPYNPNEVPLNSVPLWENIVTSGNIVGV